MKVSDADKWFLKASEQELSRLEEEQEEGLEDEMDESVTLASVHTLPSPSIPSPVLPQYTPPSLIQ